MQLLYVAFGGALGAVSRVALGDWIQLRAGTGFPWGTLAVNLGGCLLLGAALPLMAAKGLGTEWRALVAGGFLGAFTTFSTFGYETATLLEHREWARAAFYIGGSTLGGLVAVVVGMAAAAALTR